MFGDSVKEIIDKGITYTCNVILKGVDGSKKKTITILVRVGIIIAILLLLADFVWGSDLYVAIMKAEKVSSISEEISYDIIRKMSVYIFGVFVFLSGAFILEFLKQMLLQERKTHIKKIKNKLKEEYTELNRKAVVKNSRFMNDFQRLIEEHIEKNITGTVIAKDTYSKPKQPQDLINEYISFYNRICEIIDVYVKDNIRNINPHDIVHVSIKGFVRNEKEDEFLVINLGRITDYNERVDNDGIGKVRLRRKVEDLLRDGYMIDEDSAISQIVKSGSEHEVFCCSNINDMGKSYKSPSTRSYNATIVCPILACEPDIGEYFIIGALCLDTTSEYPDWEKHGSYEENLLTYVSSQIGALLWNNIIEIENIQKCK